MSWFGSLWTGNMDNESIVLLESSKDEETVIEKMKPHLSNKQKRKLRQASTQPEQFIDNDNDIRAEETISSKRLKLSESSVPLSTKKLLIFDLNHVLLDRTPFTSNFTLRPHVLSFLQEMSQFFTLAIWSSMKKSKHSRQLIRLLFQSDDPDPQKKIPILFSWFQTQCQPIYHSNGSKPTFLKNLKQVWCQFPEYSAINTVIVDDSIEKCVNNPSFSLLIPKPFHIRSGATRHGDTDSTSVPAQNKGQQPFVAEELLVMGVAFDPETQTMRETCHREVSYVSSAGRDTTETDTSTTGWTDSDPLPQTSDTKDALSVHEVVEKEEEKEDGELREDSPLRSYLRELGRFAGSVEEFVTLFGSYNV